MAEVQDTCEPQSIYELCWAYARGSVFTIDSCHGKIVDANPAAEVLTGFSRQELLGCDLSALHFEADRVRIEAEFLGRGHEPSIHPGFRIQRKDGLLTPVTISSSKSIVLNGSPVTNLTYIDITEQVESEHRLSTQNWALSAYGDATLALARASTEEGLLQSICEGITRESVYVLAWIGIADEKPEKPVRIAAAAGRALGYLDDLDVSWSEENPFGRGPTGICIRTNKSQIMEDCLTDPIYAPWSERAREAGVRSSISIAIPGVHGWRGALMVYAAQPRAFEPDAIEVFEHIAEQIVHGIHALKQEQLLTAQRQHMARMEAELTTALSAMVAPIVLAMEMRDPYTAGHQGRVAELAVAIGREMGWSEERLQGLRIAAQVHDIGKISIPAEILTKPGMLTPAERALIQGHSETGYTILKDIPSRWPIAEIVRQHHEKIDGSGYPRGLRGEEILPEARVLAVADIVEAMASYRPYRQEIKLHLVLKAIQRDAGTQLDADAVRICVDLFRDNRFFVRKGSGVDLAPGLEALAAD